MKKLFIKILLFAFLIFLTGIALSLFLPQNTYWGNKEYAWKINEYKKDNYNAVLFGTSRIYRGINPLVFDSLVNSETNANIKSFNLATHASWASETFYLYDAFLNDTSLSGGVNLVFMEFQNIMSIRPGRLGDEKAVYYQNLDNYWFMIKYSIYEVFRDPKKILTSGYSIGVYSFSTLLNVTNLKKINTKRDASPPIEVQSINDRGYLGFKDLKEVEVTDNNIRSFTENIRQFQQTDSTFHNPVFYGRITDLIERSRQRGIRLIFILPPVRLTEGMMSVFNKLPPDNKIEVCDPDKFTELYNKENWIDPVHLNTVGSTYLTRYVTNDFLKKISVQ